MMRAIKLFLFASGLLLAADVVAEEIRVVDSIGLTRAAHNVKHKGKILLTLTARDLKLPEHIIISSREGLASDIRAEHQGGGRYVATDVPSGTWKVNLPAKSFEIKDAQITE